MDSQTVTILGSVLGSTFLAAIVTTSISRFNSERAIQIENITKERKNWRETIRKQAMEVQQAASETQKDCKKLEELVLAFRLNLNPFDDEDKAIVNVIAKLTQQEKVDELLTQFSERVALLLKHDWERVKGEAFPDEFSPRAERMSWQDWKKQQGKTSITTT